MTMKISAILPDTTSYIGSWKHDKKRAVSSVSCDDWANYLAFGGCFFLLVWSTAVYCLLPIRCTLFCALKSQQQTKQTKIFSSVWDGYVYSAIFKMDNQQGPTVYSAWNSVQCYVAAGMGGEFGEKWIHIYVWLNPFIGHLKLSQHCQSAITPLPNKKAKQIFSFMKLTF